MSGETGIWQKFLKNEDWWAVWLGLFVVLLGLGPVVFGTDLLGWLVKASAWTSLAESIAPISKATAQIMQGYTSLILTYLFLLAITTIGAAVMRYNLFRFITGFSIIFFITYSCIIIGEYAYISATPDKRGAFDLPWSLGMGEMGLILAMVAGLIIGNFFTRFAKYLETAARPEWYIKIGIVILGASLGIKTIEAADLAGTIILRGLCAVVEAYLIYWPVVYYVSRRWFKLTPEWSAPLASGISICGVSASIATGAAIKARPVVPVVLSAVIIVFVAIEILVLPFLAANALYNEPLVAGAWMGLAVKSDGGAIASGTLTEALIYSKILAVKGISYAKDWVLMVTTTTKVFIDIFIGFWAFLLAVIWSIFPINKNSSNNVGIKTGKVSPKEIWNRFPKFIIGFLITLAAMFLLGITQPEVIKPAKEGASQANAIRSIFFALCFFSIGLVTNVRKLWAEGMGRIVLVYAVCLFGFIIWVGLLISWVFYHGIMPPLA